MSTSSTYNKLATDIMENYPEYSFCLVCIGYNYGGGLFQFLDPETGKKYIVNINDIERALPIVRKMLEDKKLFLDGLHSGAESFFDGGNWDSIANDAVVQVAIFKDVIYG